MAARKKKDEEVKAKEVVEEAVEIIESEPEPENVLVKMKHIQTEKLADVHPDEVKNYIKGDYVLVSGT